MLRLSAHPFSILNRSDVVRYQSQSKRYSPVVFWLVLPVFLIISGNVPTLGQSIQDRLRSENLTIREVTPDQALNQLRTKYKSLINQHGPNHAEARQVGSQLINLTRRLAEVRGEELTRSDAAILNEVLTNQNIANAPQQPSLQESGQLQLSDTQIQGLRTLYTQMLDRLGADHPRVESLRGQLERIDRGIVQQNQTAPLESTPIPTSVAPSDSNLSGIEMPDPKQEPFRFVMMLAQRVLKLEQEVNELKNEIARLKSRPSQPPISQPSVIPGE